LHPSYPVMKLLRLLMTDGCDRETMPEQLWNSRYFSTEFCL